MAASFLEAAAARAADLMSGCTHTVENKAPLIQCLMLTRWPERSEMIQHAIFSFLCQDYPHRVLTVVNDGEPCELTEKFFVAAGSASGHCVVQAPAGSTIGEKRNLGVKAFRQAAYVASFDDDDFSLPGRLGAHLGAIGDAVWLSSSRKFISLATLDNIIGFEVGRCYGAGMISTRVTDELSWPHLSWCEDHRLFEAVKAHPTFGALTAEDDALMYVHRRHDSNASVAHRESLWQGVLPLQLAGLEAITAPGTVRKLLAQSQGPYLDGANRASGAQGTLA